MKHNCILPFHEICVDTQFLQLNFLLFEDMYIHDTIGFLTDGKEIPYFELLPIFNAFKGYEEWRNNWTFLRENNLIKSLSNEVSKKFLNDAIALRKTKSIIEDKESHYLIARLWKRFEEAWEKSREESSAVETALNYLNLSEKFCQLISQCGNITKESDYTTFVSIDNQNNELAKNSNGLVLNLLLKEMPLPEKGQAWERIIDFKENLAIKNKYLRFRNWYNDLIKQELSHIEMADRVRYLISNYREQMRVSKLKYENTVLEIMISLPFQLIENTLRLKPSDSIKKIFDIKRAKIDFLESEPNIVGSEVSYLVSAHDLLTNK